ncbi:HAMP domain-containing sensor histidine kinase [Rubrobacter xylanophilus]|uniref:HAMP domain-containing sensor histidine kinase n=1 Tax=Rubrobacter xylanophilus TaxID=49319 RepID=UPI001FCBB667|nr:HAMP domain-containing sensor histidine kinase [Rubrobacter xylanophilus]
MRNQGFRRLFVLSFVGIIVVTGLASAIAVGVIFYSLRQQGESLPKVEQQVDDLQRYARSHSEPLLANDEAARSKWERRVDAADGVDYVVLDRRGDFVSGDAASFSLPLTARELAERVNEILVSDDYREETLALVDDGEVSGYLLLKYPLDNSALSTTQRVALISQVALAALLPVVFLILATLVFAWRLGRRINKPVGELRAAVEKIRNRDLDFSIGYDKPDELGELCRAFEDLRKELQESLTREWRQAEEVREMVAALSHDLRTPVTVIQGHVEGLMRAGEDKRAQRLERYLRVMEESSHRIMKLLDDIMLVVNLEQTNFSIQPQPTDLTREFARKGAAYGLRASEHGMRFELEPPSGNGERSGEVYIDPHRLEQMLDNLFENALRYTPTGGKVTVAYSWDAGSLCVAVRDTGPGVPEHEVPRIFDKAYRGTNNAADPNTKKTLGLGLYISKLLVETQDGEISARNLPEGGLEVTFRLPLRGSAPIRPPGSFASVAPEPGSRYQTD